MSAEEHYALEHVREALAKDPRVNELELQVVLAGEGVYVSGTVSSERRRAAVTEVIREMLPGREVHNQTQVAVLTGEPEEETLA